MPRPRWFAIVSTDSYVLAAFEDKSLALEALAVHAAQRHVAFRSILAATRPAFGDPVKDWFR